MGVLPDLVAFVPSAIYGLIYSIKPVQVDENTVTSDLPIAWSIYQWSHSLTIVVILFLGGIQLLALGVIGEYLGRTYLAANNYPQFSIRKTINTESMNK